MAAEKILIPCFIMIELNLRPTAMVAEVRSDDFVAGIATALSRMFEPWFIPPDISLWKVSLALYHSG